MEGLPTSERFDLPERVSKLESSVDNLHSELADLKKFSRESFGSLETAITKQRETPWQTIIAGIALVGGVYAWAVHPLQEDIARQSGEAKSLAAAVVDRERAIDGINGNIVKLWAEHEVVKRDLTEVILHGAPVIDRRLTLLEHGVVVDAGKK